MNPDLNPSRRSILVRLAGLVILSVLSSLLAATGDGPQQYYARTWQADDGLPRNIITSIAQTADGYLWLGTPLGIIRFDGVQFTPMENDFYAGFVGARTSVLDTDNSGRLWIGTSTAGVIRYDENNFTVINDRNGLPHPTITAICQDARGTVWLASQDGNISWVDGNDNVHPIRPARGKLTDAAVQLVRDARGNLWFAQGDTYGRLANGAATNVISIPDSEVMLCPGRAGGMWLSTGTELQKLPPPDSGAGIESTPLPVKRYQVRCLLEDHQGNLWIGTRSKGLFRYAHHQFTQEFKSSHRIHALFEDAESNLWIGTDGGGLSRLRRAVFHTLTVREGLPNSMVVSVCEANNGDTWVSAQGPALINRTASGQLESFSTFTNISTTCILPNPAGGIWIGTVNNGLYAVRDNVTSLVLDGGALHHRQIRVLHQDASGQLWLGCLPDGLIRLGDGTPGSPTKYFTQGQPKGAIWAMADDPKNQLWLGTIRGELWCYDGSHFTSYGQAEGLPGASIGTLLAATNGDLWIGTLGGGLGRLRDGRCVFAEVRNGLGDNVISAIVDDGLGWFWLGSDRGIFRVKKRDLEDFADGRRTHFESIRYGQDDGLENVECSGGYQPSAWRTHSGDIWFATSKGAVMVNPAALPTNPNPPKLVLEKILVDDVPLTNVTGIKLPYGYRKLEFEYTAPSFTSPERIRFRHQLVGLDPDWGPADTKRTTSYPRLAPGRYVFRFTACNANDIWNDQPVSIAFRVTPAYWQTVWFRALALLAFTGIVASGVRYRYAQKMRRKLHRLEQAHALEQERLRIARDIHDDLGARLTQMAFLSETEAGAAGGPAGHSHRMDKIAQGARQAIRSLEEIVWAVNPQKDTLPHLVDFLSHYANEFFRMSAIRCRQDLPLMIPEITLASEVRHHFFLAVKEALNNVMKHSGATAVWLRLTVTETAAEMVIEDNGRGFDMAAGKPGGNGRANLRTRLETIGGACSLESSPGRGTRVCLTLKLDNLKPNAAGPASKARQA